MIELEKLTVWKPRADLSGVKYHLQNGMRYNETNDARTAAAKTLDDFDWWHKTIEKRKANSIWKGQR